MNIDGLRDWAILHSVEEKTKTGFVDVILNLQKDSPMRVIKEFGGVFNEELLKVDPYKISFTLGNWPNCDQNYIVSFARVSYTGEAKGIYKLVFDFDGEIIDDYWSSEE